MTLTIRTLATDRRTAAYSLAVREYLMTHQAPAVADAACSSCSSPAGARCVRASDSRRRPGPSWCASRFTTYLAALDAHRAAAQEHGHQAAATTTPAPTGDEGRDAR